MRTLVLALPVFLAACASARDDRGVAEMQAPLADVAIPRGDVRVAALGIAKLEPQQIGVPAARALHVRVALMNDSGTAWSCDTREQRAMLPGFGESRPALAIANVGRAPVLVAPPGARVTAELYYPLPASMQAANEVPQVDVIWRVRFGREEAAHRSHFARVPLEPDEPVKYVAAAGSPYYYDPQWQDFSFATAVAIPPPYDRPIDLPVPPAR